MFKPELKETGWVDAPEIVFSISGEDYIESTSVYTIPYEIKSRMGEISEFRRDNPNFTSLEKELSTLLNDSLMDVIWDSITESELEKIFEKSVSNWSQDVIKIRIEFDGEFIFGWVHYKEGKKINTFRFKITLKGRFSKC